MVSVSMVEFSIYFFPIIILVIAIIGVGWCRRKNKRYLIGYILLLLGAGTHYYGLLAVGAWEGMAISLFIGGGFILSGLLVLLITFIYTKLVAKNIIQLS